MVSSFQPTNTKQTNSLAEDKKLVNGHYYNVDSGVLEGKITEGIGDVDDLYACKGKTGDEFLEKKKLDMTHSDFQKNAYILAAEAGDPGQECVCLGFTASNRAKELNWKLYML